jgi:hypothetical protein
LVIRTLMAAWESADTAVIQNLFWPQATYDDFPNQATYQGLEEIVGYVTSPRSTPARPGRSRSGCSRPFRTAR